jgi:hypothetical protein
LLVALALLFSITPGVSEVIESSVHLVMHGDLPHHDGDPDEDCGEHTCTPLAHHCGCHTTMTAMAATKVSTAATATAGTWVERAAVATQSGRVSEPPPLRPPIV